MKNFHYIFTASLCLLLSCGKETPHETDIHDFMDEEVMNYMIPEERIPLYADLDERDLIGNTGTRAAEKEKPLSSLLDYRTRTRKIIDDVSYTQTAFLPEEKEVYGVLHDKRGVYDENQVVTIRKFYVETLTNGRKNTFIATMIPTRQYEKAHPDFDYINKPNYSGLILFARPDGKLFYARHNAGGKVFETYVPTRDELDRLGHEEKEQIVYFTVVENKSTTRGLLKWLVELSGGGYYGGEIDTSVLIAEQNQPEQPKEETSTGLPRTYGGITSNRNYLETNVAGWSFLADPPSTPVYNVSVVSNMPDIIKMTGSGDYENGTEAFIDYYFEGPYDYENLPFRYWTGTLSVVPAPKVRVTVTDNINSVAYFDDGALPCQNTKNRNGNPTASMKIAASNKYGNYKGGTFGKYRTDEYGQPLMHEGLDIYAQPGTSVFSMFDGKIVEITDNAPDTYEKRSYGNRIIIKSTLTNPVTRKTETRYIHYCHLQYGNAVAFDPRTGEKFNVGDPVYMGDLIGYTGRTGNAKDVPNPHLHLAISKSLHSDFVDPKDYINGTYDISQVNKNKGNIEVKNCKSGTAFDYDEKDEDNESGSEDYYNPLTGNPSTVTMNKKEGYATFKFKN